MTESERWLGAEGSWEALLPLATVSKLKGFLWRFQHPVSPDEQLESGAPVGRSGSYLTTCARRILLSLFVLLALAAVALLLLWNYQCIFVWRLCQEGNPVVPLFWGGGTEEAKEAGPD